MRFPSGPGTLTIDDTILTAMMLQSSFAGQQLKSSTSVLGAQVRRGCAIKAVIFRALKTSFARPRYSFAEWFQNFHADSEAGAEDSQAGAEDSQRASPKGSKQSQEDCAKGRTTTGSEDNQVNHH